MSGKTTPIEALAAQLALAINVEPALIEDSAMGKCWAARFTISHPSGMFFSMTMAPENARAFAKVIQQCALECATKLVPADGMSLIKGA